MLPNGPLLNNARVFRHVKVLLADDDPSIVKVVEQRLRSGGYDVFIAHDGEEALSMAAIHRPDVIVLDIMMPKISGDLVASRLRSDPATSAIPIIFLTCLAEPGSPSVACGPEQGSYRMVGKPFDSEDLLVMIRRAAFGPAHD